MSGGTKYLGIDWGERRIGLSYGDELGVAVPLPAALGLKKKERLAQIAEVIAARGITDLVVGYPLNMDGSAGFKAREVDAFIAVLKRRFGLPVHRADERLTTHQAAGGMSANERRQRRGDGTLDSRAAALILQDFLECQGKRPGEADPAAGGDLESGSEDEDGAPSS